MLFQILCPSFSQYYPVSYFFLYRSLFLYTEKLNQHRQLYIILCLDFFDTVLVVHNEFQVAFSTTKCTNQSRFKCI